MNHDQKVMTGLKSLICLLPGIYSTEISSVWFCYADIHFLLTGSIQVSSRNEAFWKPLNNELNVSQS